jgi:L-seryl-tRNA(Ser) seleniumtransferase
VACNYSTLEYDPQTGERKDRQRHVESLISQLFKAKGSLVVNNNAAAIFLIMTALGRGKEAVISRGDLVEIGDSFRLADIMTEGGVELIEVGASNHTRIDDYKKAIIPGKTAMLVKVHPSNFRLLGYHGSTKVADLARLANNNNIPLICDLGSGSITDLSTQGLPEEHTVRSVLEAGADLVTMSGDKLFGASQAGLIVGSKRLTDILRRHPVARALRIDKFSLAALEDTLRNWLYPANQQSNIPTLAMLKISSPELKAKAENLLALLPKRKNLECEILAVDSQAGGGAGPEWPLPSWGIAIRLDGVSPTTVERRLRQSEPPVIARINQGDLLFDLRTIFPWQYETLADILAKAIF